MEEVVLVTLIGWCLNLILLSWLSWLICWPFCLVQSPCDLESIGLWGQWHPQLFLLFGYLGIWLYRGQLHSSVYLVSCVSSRLAIVQFVNLPECLTTRTHAYVCIGLCIPEQYPGRLQLDPVTYPVCICILPCVLNSLPNMGTHNRVISIQSLHHHQRLRWLLLHCFQQHPHIAILYTTLKYYNMTFSLSQSLGQLDLVLLCWHISLCDH